jgi:hypothetical protein
MRPAEEQGDVSFKATIFRFLGEVEAVFAIWVIPLTISMAVMKDWTTVTRYVDFNVSYIEPVFVVVIMAIASTHPVVRLAETLLRHVVRLGRETPASWWLATLTLGPLLGSFITEPAAMTLAAMLLAKKFYRLNPSTKLGYATIGLLFVNVSIGGTLTHFSAPPVLMVAHVWHWDLTFMATQFGWKAGLSMLADAGYFSEANVIACVAAGIEPLLALAAHVAGDERTGQHPTARELGLAHRRGGCSAACRPHIAMRKRGKQVNCPRFPCPDQSSGGRRRQWPVACSKAWPSCSTAKSWWWRPVICRPTGKPFAVNPAGTDSDGRPSSEITWRSAPQST